MENFRQGQIVSRPRLGEAVDLLMGGGVSANFPFKTFDRRRYLYPNRLLSGSAGEAIVFIPKSLGVRLDREEQIQYDQAGKGLAPYPSNVSPTTSAPSVPS